MNLYGERLVCVRYRDDVEGQRKITTVEIVAEERPWHPVKQRIPDDAYLSLKVEYGEVAIGRAIRDAGGQWYHFPRGISNAEGGFGTWNSPQALGPGSFGLGAPHIGRRSMIICTVDRDVNHFILPSYVRGFGLRRYECGRILNSRTVSSRRSH